MHAWDQIQITIDYMKEHLNQEISIAALAEKAGVIIILLSEIIS